MRKKKEKKKVSKKKNKNKHTNKQFKSRGLDALRESGG